MHAFMYAFFVKYCLIKSKFELKKTQMRFCLKKVPIKILRYRLNFLSILAQEILKSALLL